MTTKEIDMKSFSLTPYGRYRSDGPNSGESFRTKHLAPALKDPNFDKVVVKLDSVTPGYEYSSSFLEEAFGGLVRVNHIPAKTLLEKLEVVTKHGDYKLEIKKYIDRASA